MSTCPLIAIPHFGDDLRYLRMLHAWVDQLRATMGESVRFTIFTHDQSHVLKKAGYPTLNLDISSYADIIRPKQPFDIKGALMCEAALAIKEPFLMLDADAMLVKDPSKILAAIAATNCSCAMPIDAGAVLHGHKLYMDGAWSNTRKMCAGVFWFGDIYKRGTLTALYRNFWKELRDADYPWTPRLPHLLEQYAWSCAHRALSGETLPGSMNYAPHLIGPNEGAIVNHYFGHKKWDGKGKPPSNV